MNLRVVAIGLKIPDNEAYTALVALRRAGVNAAKLERAVVWRVEDTGDAASFVERVEHNEAIFNPNKHTLTVLEGIVPRPGEVWVEEFVEGDDAKAYFGGKMIEGVTRAHRCVSWRLFDEDGAPAGTDVVQDAVDRLLCNPAIERATIG